MTELSKGIKTLKISMIVSTVVSLAIALTGEPVLAVFTNDPIIIAIGLPVLWAIVFIEPGRAMNIVLMGSLKSVGDVRFPLSSELSVCGELPSYLATFLGLHLV